MPRFRVTVRRFVDYNVYVEAPTANEASVEVRERIDNGEFAEMADYEDVVPYYEEHTLTKVEAA